MKKLLLLIICTAALIGCGKDGDGGDTNKLQYLYEITMKESIMNNIIGDFGLAIVKNRSRYDEKGNMIYNNIPYWSDITQDWMDYETTYKYNSGNMLIEKECLSIVTQYIYNTSKLLIEEKCFTGLLLNETITYSYEEGRLVRSDEHDVRLNRHYYTTYEYNTQGQLSKKTKYKKPNDIFETADTYEYDNQGNIVVECHWYSISSMYKTTNLNYTYNSDGSINTVTDLGADVYFDGVQKKSTYFYNEKKQLIRIETNVLQSGNPKSIQTFEYIYKYM